jgi:uncharacterized protein YuzE
MKMTYDHEANASYIYINESLPVTHSQDVETPNALIVIDFSDDQVVGIEIVNY